MKRVRSIAIIALIGWAIISAASMLAPKLPASAQTKPAGSPSPVKREEIEVTTIFDGRLSLRSEDQRINQPQVTVRRLVIYDRQKIERPASQDFVVYQCLSGEIATTINNNRQERKSDELWVVPAGATLSLETDRDTAIVQSWTIGRGPKSR